MDDARLLELARRREGYVRKALDLCHRRVVAMAAALEQYRAAHGGACDCGCDLCEAAARLLRGELPEAE